MNSLGHGGNLRRLAEISGRPEEEILDFSANVNPVGFPEWFRPLIDAQISRLRHYPDPDCSQLVNAAAKHYGVPTAEIMIGNGSTELLYLLPRALKISRALIPVPSYADYARAVRLEGGTVEPLPLREEDGFAPDLPELEKHLRENDAVFLGQPNNPTGLLYDAAVIRNLARRHPKTMWIIDEAFMDFVEKPDSLTRDRPSNVAVLLSLTKIFAMPGLRLGCAIADRGVIVRLREIQPPWSVNAVAQAVGAVALHDDNYLDSTRHYVREMRARLIAGLQALPGLTVYPGQANFLLVRLDRRHGDAPALASKLLSDGLAIRVCDNYEGLDQRFFRIAVRTETENDRLIDAVQRSLGIAKGGSARRKTPSIMFQGTSSNAGKSVLTAALCRILLQDGYRVAPFKAQNMSLNSFVTLDGGEMGRAQVVQAQACRLDADVRMNPVLLKPSTDTGAQVILNGKPVGNMSVGEYIRYKPQAFEAVKAAYDSLAAESDVMVLEGAGSPAEVNLKHHDIVNMAMARHAGARVLLVGDIDRGGVFASFVGTLEVLSEWERELVAGFVVNRFRGNEDLLHDALEYTRRHTGRPVLGVIPYLRALGIPEEDSVEFKSGALDDRKPASTDTVEIVVVDLAHISNFTDFDALRIEPDVRLRVARSPFDIGQPDALILPGSKNVIGDLEFLRHNQFEPKIAELARSGKTEIVGICGGFQMLGADIGDPYKVESLSPTVQGFGLLDIATEMATEKTLTRAKATHIESNLPIQGYEIHHGRSRMERVQPLVRRSDGEIIGARSASGMIWGTYLHGVFDADEFRRWFIDRLRVRRGLPAIGKATVKYDLEPALDRLAEAVRAKLNLGEVYRLMGLK
jgi:cobyric acid synthase CobQ/L-threonine-O-3-phosphate decarboxylase